MFNQPFLVSNFIFVLIRSYVTCLKGVEYIKKVSKGAKIRSRYNQVPHPAQDSYSWESYKLTVRHHKREPRGQPFPSR